MVNSLILKAFNFMLRLKLLVLQAHRFTGHGMDIGFGLPGRGNSKGLD